MKTPRVQVQSNDARGDRLFAIARPLELPVLAKDDDPLPEEICWMPRGATPIVATTPSGEPWDGTVVCDEAGFRVVEQDFLQARAGGQRVWIDENHNDEAATADLTSFRWDPARGVMATVKWTPLGARMLRERQYCSFSPSFFVGSGGSRLSGLVTGHASGGLTNSPAFGARMPALIAARMAGAKPTTEAGAAGAETKQAMKDILLKILAALGITPPADAKDEDLLALAAKHADKITSKDALTAIQAQLTELRAKADNAAAAQAVAEMKKTVDALQAAAAASRTKSAQAAVQAAVDRGALAKDDKTSQEFWQKLLENDETDGALKQLNAMKGTKTENGNGAEVIVIPDFVQRELAAKGALGGSRVQILRTGIVDALKGYANAKSAKERAGIYAASIGPLMRDDPHFRLGPVLADNSLGSLSGDLIVQRSLTLLKLAFPILTAISTDFSGENVKFNQDVISRIRTIPATSNFVAGTGYTTEDAGTTDVPVTINAHKGVEISFNANELGSSDRDLFGEQVEGCHYSLGKALVDAIYARLTVANFANETVSALNDFNRPEVAAMAQELNTRGVPTMGRFLLLNAAFFGKLQEDSSIVQLAAFQRPEIITEYLLPRIAGFQPYEAINLPADPGTETQALVGFGGTPDSLVIATRPPSDYAQALPGASNGVVSTVTNPDTGITVQLVQFVDHKKAAAFWRVALMYGTAKGQAASGQRLVSEATSS